VQADDLRLLGIPRSRQIVAIIYPRHGTNFQGFLPPSGWDTPPERSDKLVRRTSVVRVQPRTFRSITDLLLALA
jgi:hypothetical protein